LLLGLLTLLATACLPTPGERRLFVDDGRQEVAADGSEVTELRRRSAQAESMTWLGLPPRQHPWLQADLTRSAVVAARAKGLLDQDNAAAARMSGLLAAEAHSRALQVLERWIPRIDAGTGLLPKGVSQQDQVWEYADTGADLFPHLLIAASLLRPEHVPVLRNVIARERALTGPLNVPPDVDLPTNHLQNDDLEDRIYGGVEYAKDGLLPLTERLGQGPWLDRMQELARAVDLASAVDSRYGKLPSDEGEVNGQVLQVLTRLYWATGDERYLPQAERIARAYLEAALPSTGWVPARTWDFPRGRPNTDRAQLRDHGNEIVAGLVEYHLIETIRQEPDVETHRGQIRAMLNRLLEIGRSSDGLWRSAIDLETGKPLADTLSDNWGYLYAAYLTQAQVEERLPGGDSALARRYREAAQVGLHAAARREFYPWQGVEQDGTADTIESALYLLNRIPAPDAEAWVDRQAGILFGAQDGAGRVEDRYLEGNFVRTALLYAAWQTQGASLEPWTAGVMIGAARARDCVQLALASDRDWTGRLAFDAPRHQLNLHLPWNYPRLNEWPEWFAPVPGRAYRLEDPLGPLAGSYDGATLSQGLPVQLQTGVERQIRVCPDETR
jgi:hypothetical protein